MTTVPRRARRTPALSVPLADVRALLRAVEAILDMPTADIPDALRHRLAHASGVLSTVEDARGLQHATAVLRRVVEGGAQ